MHAFTAACSSENSEDGVEKQVYKVELLSSLVEATRQKRLVTKRVASRIDFFMGKAPTTDFVFISMSPNLWPNNVKYT